ncbi:kinase-like domain-containing protein [Tribonema minus]|uniref:non-specific serine/threonine protein kinase n=1 Tax=Tribonema minus TaxID=303371 RepID=A0A835ZHC9_9STRA|nr:kinase-like domain-containing protein [Tribonema minus]
MKPDDLFGQVYTLGPRLGAGAFSVVHKCLNKRDGREYAVKIVDKNALVREDRDALDNEIMIMNEISHPNIVQLAEVYRESNIYYLVMELARGGELFERIVERTCYTEDCARELLRLLIVTVQYLHRSSIVHRDLKPENLLLVSEGDDCFIKIADFGFAEHISELDCCNAACGTPQYVSPEILQGRHYTATVDIWSIGVIAFVLMGGYPPFYDREKTELFRKIIRGEFEFLSPFWDHISDDAKDFICCMLVVNPERRHNAAQLLEHRWVQETLSAQSNVHTHRLQFRMYRSKRRFRAVVSHIEKWTRIDIV